MPVLWWPGPPLAHAAGDRWGVHADRLVVVRQLNRLLKRSEEGADHLLFLAAEDTSNRQSQV